MTTDTHKHIGNLERGVSRIRDLAKTLPDTPGVYRMVDKNGDVLYVGKAKALKKRVLSYTNPNKQSVRIQRMIAETADMVFVHTHTEVEALLLESNLIKKLKPRYNVLLRDDKSFPYIHITDHDYPLLTKYRGARDKAGDFFGPFASAGAVNHTIATLQRVFMLRNCSDNVFANRNRPCLQYHIKRCTAPCVDYVSQNEYGEQVKHAKDFLAGKSRAIQDHFADKMQAASDAQDYETAATYRDRIQALAAVQSKQDINVEGLGDADIMALYQDQGRSCVQVFFFRGGQNYGNRAYFPRHSQDDKPEDILAAFMAQFYDNKPVPPAILVSHTLPEKVLMEEAFSQKKTVTHKVKIQTPAKGARKRLIDFVMKNAKDALERDNLKRTSELKNLDAVAKLFDMDDKPQRIEIYDNSHSAGQHMVGAMVVAGPEGLQKNAYRKFNIKTAAQSDDYGMMREVMERRFGRALREGKKPDDPDWPDLLLIDGGKGQLSTVMAVLTELGIEDTFRVVAISKGEDRNAGREFFHLPGQDAFQLHVNDPVLHYLQRLRDEAHRFAIGSHRVRRRKAATQSSLDDVPGIGPKRKKALLHHFGSAKEVETAGIKDLMAVEGISRAFAKKVYNYFH